MTFKATFTGLNPEEEYFPMISRSEPQAFFGLAPAPVRPTSPVHIRRSSPTENALPMRQHDVRDAFNGGHEDLYGASSDSGSEFMDVDMPHPSPSTQTSVTESESDPDGRDENVQSRSVSPANPPQVPRRLVTIRPRTHNNDQLQRAKDTTAHLNGELGSAHTTLESLRDEVSRLSAENEALKAQLEGGVQNHHTTDTKIQAAQVQAEAKKEQLVAKELELQAARAEIQQQRKSIDDISAALRNKGAEIEKLRKANERLENMNQNAKAEVETLHTLIQDLKKENEVLLRDLQLDEVDCDKQVKLANEIAERMSRRGKRARENNEGNALASSKRSRTGITARGESATELTGKDGDGTSGGEISFTT